MAPRATTQPANSVLARRNFRRLRAIGCSLDWDGANWSSNFVQSQDKIATQRGFEIVDVIEVGT
jgi:hypothetical protein